MEYIYLPKYDKVYPHPLIRPGTMIHIDNHWWIVKYRGKDSIDVFCHELNFNMCVRFFYIDDFI